MSKNKETKNFQEIDASELENVSGGYIYNTQGKSGLPDKPWEVLDDGDGTVVGRYKTKDEAIESATTKRQSRKQLNHKEASELKEQNPFHGIMIEEDTSPFMP